MVDGQHRIHALLELGLGEWFVDVAVHLDVTTNEQACLVFLRLNDRAPVSCFDKFKAELVAGVEESVAIDSLASSFGLRVTAVRARNAIRSIACLRRAYRLDAGKSLRRALAVIVDAWGKHPDAFEGVLIEGLSILLGKQGADIDTAVMVQKLKKYEGGAGALIGKAAGRAKLLKVSGARGMAEEIHSAYCVGRRKAQK